MSSRLLCLQRLIVIENRFPRNVTVSHNQRVETLPPPDISSFATQKPNHVDQIGNFRWTQRRLEGRHETLTLGDRFADLVHASSFNSLTKIGKLNRKRGGDRTVASSRGTVATHTALRVKLIHTLITAAAAERSQKQTGERKTL